MMYKKLSIQDSNVLKGIAILLMLCHHLFYSSDYGFTDIKIHSFNIINTFALMCKVCVAIFVFISGYGLTEKYKGKENINLKKFYWNRFVKLFINYWFIWLIFVPISVLWLGPSFAEQYGGNHIPAKIVLDFIGILNWFDIYPYNPTWWFYSCIIGLYIMYPLFHSIAKKNTLYIVALAIAIYFLPSRLLMCVRLYILTFVCGILYSKYDNMRGSTITPTRWSWCILFITLFICRVKVIDSILYDALIVIVGITTYQYLNINKFIKKSLDFVGRHSMSMFLTHTFIFFIWPVTHNLIYASNNPLIIYITGVASSLVLAVLIDKTRGVLKINKLVFNLRNIM